MKRNKTGRYLFFLKGMIKIIYFVELIIALVRKSEARL